ncbi:hypothetical protein QA601_10815 [Chitinispirillales bacterium ANBcel5]|uniref:hypothetical protein n=1 Tax=Cellulosispirillum alkaliphilum TaxID=3039283 RepID=UPI002A4FDE52|nr:hypothetical protein [Chitinispirillales bacterium ANBcel5]
MCRANLLSTALILIVCSFATVLGQQNGANADSLAIHRSALNNSFEEKPYSPSRDMAFVSVRGQTPNIPMNGFRRAVLYNAKGAKISEMDISRSDSVVSLDKMIRENSNRGPLIIQMIR